MRDYCVLRPFNGHQAGETLRLNDRQAKYLVPGGPIGAPGAADQPATKPTAKTAKKGGTHE